MTPLFARRLVLFALYVTTAVVLLAITSGLAVNWQTRAIEQRGGLRVASDPKVVEVYLNNKLVSHKTPFQTTSLKPGGYHVDLKKPGYQTWSQDFAVRPGQVNEQDNILLFKSERLKRLVTNQTEKDRVVNDLKRFPDTTRFGDITTAGPEILIDDQFLTRFSEDIIQATWFHDGDHLLVQTGRQLLILERDGKQRLTVAETTGSSPLSWTTDDSDRTLYIVDNGVMTATTLR